MDVIKLLIDVIKRFLDAIKFFADPNERLIFLNQRVKIEIDFLNVGHIGKKVRYWSAICGLNFFKILFHLLGSTTCRLLLNKGTDAVRKIKGICNK